MEKKNVINRRSFGGLIGGIIGLIASGPTSLLMGKNNNENINGDDRQSNSLFTGDTLKFELQPDWEQLPKEIKHGDVAGVAVDSKDQVYMITRSDARVLVYKKDGTFIRTWGGGKFSLRPHGIGVDGEGNVYVVDELDQSVRKFSPEGKELLVLGNPGKPSDTGIDVKAHKGVQYGGVPFNGPTGVSIAADGEIYVSDGYGNARVHRFAPDGKLIQSWGEPGIEPGQFHLPHGVCVTRDNRVMVTDRENDRIQIFSRDGKFLDMWTHVQRPTTLCEDKEGNIYVSTLWWKVGESSFRNGPIRFDLPGHISMYDPKGNLLLRWISSDKAAPGNFVAPHGIAVDSTGDLYVAEVTQTFGIGPGYVPAGTHSFQKFLRRGKIKTYR